MIPLDRVLELGPDETAIDALGELGESQAQRAIVLEHGRLVGILSAADVARALEVRPRAGRLRRNRLRR
jgi:CBS domain-containing protein